MSASALETSSPQPAPRGVPRALPGSSSASLVPRSKLPEHPCRACLPSLTDTHSPTKPQPGGALLAAPGLKLPRLPTLPSLYDPHPGTRDAAGACVAPRRVSPKPASTVHSFTLAFTEPQTGHTSGECLFSKHVAIYYFPPGSHWPQTHSS